VEWSHRATPAVEVAAALLVEAALASQYAGDFAGAVAAEIEIDADVLIANLRDGLPAPSTTTKGMMNSSVTPLL